MVDVPVPVLDQPVGIEGDDRALGQVDFHRLEGQPADPEGRSGGHGEELRGAAGQDEGRRRVAGSGQGEAAGDGIVDGVEAGGAEFGDLFSAVVGGQVGDQVVEVGEELVRGQVDVGEGAHGRAQPAHGGRGLDAVADHVADDQPDPAARERDHVEPVAADARQRSGRQIPVSHLDRGLSGQPPGQQAVLEGVGGAAFAGEAAGVVDADGGAAGELLGEDGVVGRVVLRVARPHAHRDAQRGAAGQQRYGDHGVDAHAVGAALGTARVALREPLVEVGLAGAAEDRPALLQGAGRRRGRLVAVHLAQMDGHTRVALLRGSVRDAAQREGAVRDHRQFVLPEDPVQQVDAGEVGVLRDEQLDQLLGGTHHVQGGADAGGRLVQQGEAAPGPVLLTAVECCQRDPGQLAGDVPQGPHLDAPRMHPARGRSAGEALVAHRQAGLGDLAQMMQKALAVLGVLHGLRIEPADQRLLGHTQQPAGRVVGAQIALPEVEDRHGHGRLLEGLVGQGRSGHGGGDHMSGLLAARTEDRAGAERHLDPVAVAVAQCDGAGPCGEDTGGYVLGEETGHRPADDLVRRVPREQPRALAPPGQPALGINDRRGRDTLHMPKDDPNAPTHQARGRPGSALVSTQYGQRPIGMGVHAQFAADDLQHRAVLRDDEGDPLGRREGEAPPDAEPLTHRPVGVGEQGHAERVPSGELLLPFDAVAADADGAGTHGREFRGQVAEVAGLGRAAGGQGGGIEEQHDRPVGQQLGEPPGGAALVGQREVLGLVPDLDALRHDRPSPLRATPRAHSTSGTWRGSRARAAVRCGAGRWRQSTASLTLAGKTPTKKAAAALAATARVRGEATPAASASSTTPLPYVHALGEPGSTRGIVASNCFGEAKWATPAAASRPASSRGDRSDRGTVPPLVTCRRILLDGRARGAPSGVSDG